MLPRLPRGIEGQKTVRPQTRDVPERYNSPWGVLWKTAFYRSGEVEVETNQETICDCF
jgi:hypothetical protein